VSKRITQTSLTIFEVRRKQNTTEEFVLPLSILILGDNSDAAQTLAELLILHGHSVRDRQGYPAPKAIRLSTKHLSIHKQLSFKYLSLQSFSSERVPSESRDEKLRVDDLAQGLRVINDAEFSFETING
jgi:hypothetical protein